jgi:hypothetical protein
VRITSRLSASALVTFALGGCAGNAAPPPETPAATQPLERHATNEDAATPTAPSGPDFASACPDSDSSRPIRVVLELDRDVDWKQPPDKVLESLETEWKSATRECHGARVERPEDRVLAVELPEPCGAERVSGKLKLWLVPEGGKGYASARVEGRMGALAVAAWAYVDPSPEPKTACVTAVLDPPSGAAHPSPAALWVSSLKLQRALFGLFFPPLLLAPAPIVEPR